jgi:hypothetical protein
MELETLSPESPLRLPLVRQMLGDRTVAIKTRAVDARWRDRGKLTRVPSGFNPLLGTVYVPRHSGVEAWLREPSSSARPFNHHDRMLNDLLFAVHDYLHVWSARLIRELRPDLGFGAAPVTRANFDDYIFCHLVTEAAATVGLDYWYLCTVDLAEVLPIGSVLRGGVTTPYHERDLPEYRRFHPDLDVQSPGFFESLCKFYCSGEFVGFAASDLLHSPLLMAWLQKEVVYGKTQRENARLWFAYLSADAIEIEQRSAGAPIDTSSPARAELMREVGAALWSKVKHDDMLELAQGDVEPPASPERRRPDFRFHNANCVEDEVLLAHGHGPDFESLVSQVVARHDFAAFDHGLDPMLPILLEKRDPRLLGALRGQPRLDGCDEPRDVMVLG